MDKFLKRPGAPAAAAKKKPKTDGVVDLDAATKPEVSRELVGEFGSIWAEKLLSELTSKYFTDCMEKVVAERKKATVYPPPDMVFNAFRLCPFDKVRVVIVGQDPYHGPNQAMGLCFSVPRGTKVPPSLANIYKAANITCDHGDLTSWGRQGVLLLNTLLTVEQSKPMSHKDFGWDRFTTAVISAIGKERSGVIFLLWGLPAQKKCKMIDRKKHIVLEAVHPSPLSAYRGFMECGHFDKVNKILRGRGETEINWEPNASPERVCAAQ
jgi:uracil-DNA glycosylase